MAAARIRPSALPASALPAAASALILLWACAGGGSGKDIAMEGPERPGVPAFAPSYDGGKASPDKGIARLLASENLGLAQSTADSLSASADPMEREIGTYWKAVCYLYRDRPDSAVAILEPMQGRWSGGLRAIHGEAFLRLAREAGEARAASRVRRDEVARLSHENDAMSRETGALKAEIARLETEKKKYEKLIKELETIR
jgi:hypothetical protein